jgi:hypothetical protein
VLTYGGKRFYFSGDTEGIPEMRALRNIDVAFIFPPQGAANPTPTILALTLRTADAIVDRYIKSPGSIL